MKSDDKSPLENFFNLPIKNKKDEEDDNKSLSVEKNDIVEYDSKDNDVEKNYKEVHDIAISMHDRIVDELEDIEPKYSARMYEVAAGYLNIALTAAEKRGKMKEHKDKLGVSAKKKSTNNNVVVINTNDLIKKLSSDIIEGEVTQIPSSDKLNDE